MGGTLVLPGQDQGQSQGQLVLPGDPKHPDTQPKPSVGERLTRGYNPDVEQWAEKHPIIGPIGRYLDEAGGALLNAPRAFYDALRKTAPAEGEPLFSTAPIGRAAEGSALAPWGKASTWRAAPSVLPEALGIGTGNAAAAEAAGAISSGIGRTSELAATRVLRGPGGYGDIQSPVGKFPGLTRELEARVPRNEPPTARGEMYEDLAQRRVARGEELGSQENPGWVVKLPNRMPKGQTAEPPRPFAGIEVPERQAAIPRPGAPTPAQDLATRQSAATAQAGAETEGISGSVARPSGNLIKTEPEFQAADQLQRIAEARAREHGMQYAAGMRPAGGGRVPTTPTRTMTEGYPGPREVVPLGRTAELPATPQSAVEAGGGKWLGIQKMYGTRPDQVLFQAPNGTTLSLDAEGVTPELVRAKIVQGNGRFAPPQEPIAAPKN